MIVPVILSGGAGARLWPLSRQSCPKPFIVLPEGDTLIRRTYERALSAVDAQHVVTVTNRDLAYLTMYEYQAVNRSDVHNTYLLEPEGRDTATAIALAAVHIAETFGEQAVMLVLPADHIVSDQKALRDAVQEASQLAGEGLIVVFGIRPTRPETGFGYIEAEGRDVLRFVEKPDAEAAKAYLEAGNYHWNSGMFCFQAGTMLAAMSDLCPDILSGVTASLTKASRMTGTERVSIDVDAASFASIRAISIDYAVLEHADNLALVSCECGWSDVGSWTAMQALWVPDGNGNRMVGETAIEGSLNCYVQAQDRLVSLVGVQDLIVVDTADAVLVAHKDRTQDVKTIYSRLSGSGHATTNLHRTVQCPWGRYTVLEEGPRFKIKRIEVKPGSSLSLQKHHHRSEHWIVVSGTASVTNGLGDMLLMTDQATYIPCGNAHRLSNPGKIPLVIIEVQSGDYLGEDDIIRFEDAYGRA